jgi:hypothetical protein
MHREVIEELLLPEVRIFPQQHSMAEPGGTFRQTARWIARAIYNQRIRPN